MPRFLDSPLCNSHGACAACLHPANGERWRARHAAWYDLSGMEPGVCPHGATREHPLPIVNVVVQTPVAAPATLARPASPNGYDGSALWETLHRANGADAAWLAAWSSRVPCGACKNHWRAVLAELPPVYGDGWWEWTWKAHNAVNRAISKPEMSMADAAARWGR